VDVLLPHASQHPMRRRVAVLLVLCSTYPCTLTVLGARQVTHQMPSALATVSDRTNPARRSSILVLLRGWQWGRKLFHILADICDGVFCTRSDNKIFDSQPVSSPYGEVLDRDGSRFHV
jgi:hypothetical protein